MSRTKPFSRFEWMIAWRYLRARRTEGGVSVMTWISLLGVALAVFALIATMSVRSGFRGEFVDTILGANAHVTLYSTVQVNAQGQTSRLLTDYAELAERVRGMEGVTRVAPLIRGQVLGSYGGRNVGVDVYGIRKEDLETLPGIGGSDRDIGGTARFEEGIAIGSGVARELGVSLGQKIKLISPDGVKTAFGTSPRTKFYEVVQIFSVGRFEIDKIRVYMPFDEAQSYFNREAGADELEVMVADPDAVDDMTLDFFKTAGDNVSIWTWRDASGGYLRALEMEDNVMFILMTILVIIATMNIVSGLIMLVKNKGRDIGILRTMGLTEASVLRVFFICGASIGIVGTIVGTIMGCLFALYIDPIFALVNFVAGGGVWDPEIRGVYALPAKLMLGDVISAVTLSLVLSFVVTYFPARRAARMNPVEALRYE